MTCRSEKRCSSIVASYKHKLFCSRHCCYFAIKHSTIQINTLHYFSRPGELPSVALYCCIIMGRNSRFSQVCRFLSGRKKPVAPFSFKFTLRSSISGRARFYISFWSWIVFLLARTEAPVWQRSMVYEQHTCGVQTWFFILSVLVGINVIVSFATALVKAVVVVLPGGR